MFEAFAHYLAYGATDQQTFRDLRTHYNGVLVPGTIAAWQRQGTGGFVLSLSATQEAPPYVIDPRFPLFQQGLKDPKQSHLALADLLADPSLIRNEDPEPDSFPDERLERLAKQWVGFNSAYGVTSNEKFDKYAARLGEESGEPGEARGPEAVLAPYFACGGSADRWWALSKRLFEHSRVACSDRPCVRVVCAREGGALGSLVEDLGGPEQLVVWVSGLDEQNAPSSELAAYRMAITGAADRGHEVFGLYGGFFSVLLGVAGLRGAAHGVGFSEHRSWRELPESGAPPARFYLRRAHRYVSQDLAQILNQVSSDLTDCPCPHCDGRPPVALDYHDLMKHSVWCRAEEINQWCGRPAGDAADALESDHAEIAGVVRVSGLPPSIRTRAFNSIEPMLSWTEALRA